MGPKNLRRKFLGVPVFDLGALAAALAAHGQVARVVIAGVEGSAPREGHDTLQMQIKYRTLSPV